MGKELYLPEVTANKPKPMVPNSLCLPHKCRSFPRLSKAVASIIGNIGEKVILPNKNKNRNMKKVESV